MARESWGLRRKNEGRDEELKLQFEAVSRLDPEEKKLIRFIIESLIIRHDARKEDNRM